MATLTFPIFCFFSSQPSYSASNRPHFCGFSQFWAFCTLIREREMRKKCLQNNPNRASERNAEKLLTIPNRASSSQTSELWVSCAVHTFILLTSAVLNGNNLVWRMREPGISDLRVRLPRNSALAPSWVKLRGLVWVTVGSPRPSPVSWSKCKAPESNLCETPIEESKVTGC